MAKLIKDRIEGAAERGERLLCLDADSFMQTSVLKNKAIPWMRPTEYVAAQSQVLALLKSDFAVFNVASFYAAWIGENHGFLAEMRGKNRVRFALKRLLAMEEPRELASDIVTGLSSSVPQPLLLQLPENAQFVNWANMLANGAEERPISDLDVDSVSVYFADFLRAFSGVNVAGVILVTGSGADVSPALKELYAPIMNVARHYRWSIGAIAPGPADVRSPQDVLDFLISDHPDASGAILEQSFWDSGAVPRACSLYYSHVPSHLDPNLALKRIAALRHA